MTESFPAKPSNSNETKLLGPFLGYVTTSSIKVWLHLEGSLDKVFVTLHPNTLEAEPVSKATLELSPENLFTDCKTVMGLHPDTGYFYRLWTDSNHSEPLDLQGLHDNELRFRTLSDDPNEQIDFVIMSCHNPDVATEDGHDGYAVWSDIPQIIARGNNEKVRFALLIGDQVYADEWEKKVLSEKDENIRLRHYLDVYRHFWSNINYRRVLCSLPAMMMWDDHDITDGWGSRSESFKDGTGEFTESWQGLFDAAFKAFSFMQASRNPEPLAKVPRDGLDSCFTVGKWGFMFLDLRTNRNVAMKQVHTSEQFDRLRQWVDANKGEMHTLFVISPVVFSHGSPVIEDLAVRHWRWVMRAVAWLANLGRWGQGLQTKFDKSVGDITDDIKDSWGWEGNAKQTDRLLDFLFDLQNDSKDPVGVVIVSGDIHTSGYANIYSNYQRHAGRSSILHVTSSSVAYTPFNWFLEAIYRYATKSVSLGTQGAYSSQISHHFSARSLAVLSLRPVPNSNDHQLKVKFYLEAFPEPQVFLFDLKKVTHRENITWATRSVSEQRYAPVAQLDVEALIALRTTEVAEKLNPNESIVDMLKLFGLDSSLDARKHLAKEWGYKGELTGSPDMNIFLLEEMKERIKEAGGKVPPQLVAPSSGSAQKGKRGRRKN